MAQLARVLARYRFGSPAPEPLPDDAPDGPAPDSPRPRWRHVSMHYDDDGHFHLSATLGADEGSVVERALAERRQAEFCDRHPGADGDADPADVSWADALVSVATRSLDTAATTRSHRHRTMVNVHVGVADAAVWGHLHLGPELSGPDRRYTTCDARVRAIFEAAGLPVSVGRASYTVPTRTRLVIEDRDRGCRVPGCERRRWLHCHHIVHWEDGGTTDTWNLVSLCPFHHRLHHRGMLGISGNPDDPDGLVFTDARGRRITGCGAPAPPTQPLPEAAAAAGIDAHRYQHPSGEALNPHWVTFNEFDTPSAN